MCAMSHAIREKPRWWEKIKEPEIMARWKKEVLKQQEPLPRYRQLTEAMVRVSVMVNNDHYGTIIRQVDYVLDELHGYASLRDRETGIEVGAFSTFACDSLTSRFRLDRSNKSGNQTA